MSKKITLLITGLLLVCGVTSYSQVPNMGGHNILFRPTEVMSSIEINNGVNQFEEGLLYQLVTDDGKLLVQSRLGYEGYGYPNGSLVLKLVEPQNASINYSLWTIKAFDDGQSGKNFVFVNKETGMELEYGHVNAYSNKDIEDNDPYLTGDPRSYIGGCLQNWSWYSTDRQISDFNYAPLYSYFSNQDSVVVLQSNDAYFADEIIARKYSKDEAGTNMITILDDIIKVKPILAGEILLSSNDINQMVDFKYESSPYTNKLDNGFQLNASIKPTVESPLLTNELVAVENYDLSSANVFLGLEPGDAQNYVKLQVPIDRDKDGYYYSYQTLYVGTDYYDNNSKELKLELMEQDLDQENIPEGTGFSADSWIARSLFKFKYYPSQDSLVIEPMNASHKDPASGKWINAEYAFNSVNNDMAAIWSADGVNAPTHNDSYGDVVIRLAYLTDKTSVLTAKNAELDGGYEFPGSLQTCFTFKNRDFNYLTRTTLSDGLYFIKSADNGKSVVANLRGRLMFDAAEDDQNYDDMPATMWVVKQTGCGDRSTVAIYNREYPFDYYSITNGSSSYCSDYWDFAFTDTVPVFKGQLYKDTKGNIFFIDENYEGFEKTECSYCETWTLSHLHNYNFIPVTDQEALTSEHHGYKYLDPESLPYTKYYLNYNLFANEDLYLNVVDNSFMPREGQSTTYELEIAPDSLMATNNKFGLGAGIAGLPHLSRTAYMLKVSDKNLIDNDKMYIALVEEFGKTAYYMPMHLDDIKAGKGKMGVFYLKADQRKGDEKCYILIDIYTNYIMKNECSFPSEGDEIARYSYAFNGWKQAHCVDGLGKLSISELDRNAEDRSSAFAVITDNRPLYMDLGEVGKNINIFRGRGAGREYLFEDSNNASYVPGAKEKFNFLGATAELIKPGENYTTALYADYVLSSTERMPQYLFVVRPDSVKDGKWCNEHGYNPNCEHEVDYNGYLSGSFLINLTDSVQGGTNMLNNPDAYKWQSYTRLGFVEGVHQIDATGEYLYILKKGTLKDLKAKYGVIAPSDLADQTLFEQMAVDGLHKNYAFSLRYTDDDHQDFLLESNKDGVSGIASFKGAWVKIHNGVPVLAEYEVDNSNHQDDREKMKELINQSQIFNLEETVDFATSNDEISASAISVVTGKSSVTIRNAAGKVVSITNVLGQPLAKEILTSDNAIISAPQGLIIISIEGEDAVKAIVK